MTWLPGGRHPMACHVVRREIRCMPLVMRESCTTARASVPGGGIQIKTSQRLSVPLNGPIQPLL